MTSLSLATLLLLCVSVHACTALSPPSLTKKETPHKGLDKIKLLETLTVSSVMDYKQEENQPQQQKVANNEIIIEETSGTSFQMDSPSFLAAQDERRHARSMLGPAQLNHEETVVTNTEDIVQMDYAQPHRRPPIHNQKP